MGGWCGTVIIVSALSQRKREQRERELDNAICFSEQVKLGYQENFTSLMEGFNLPKKFCYYQNEHYPLFYFVEPLDGYK